VISIVGRFLEHPRILYVGNGGEEELYLSSGDWMPRNLSRRVETMFPIEDPEFKRRLLDEILAIKLRDNQNAWELQPDGCYRRIRPRKGEAKVDSQAYFLEKALSEHNREPERSPALDLLPHTPASEADANGVGKLVLTELFPRRQAPPHLPLDSPHPPDPQPPAASHGDVDLQIDEDELSDTSGL
jgi:hypothetical protein